MENSEERVCVVIDEANLYIGFRRFGFDGCRLDEATLVEALSLGRNVVDKVIVDSYHSEPDNKSVMLEMMERKGFRVVARICDGKQKGVDCDVNNVVVIGALQDLYDTVVIVSGDGDMISAAEVAHSKGKRVEFASFGNSFNGMLSKECDFFHPLDRIRMVDASKLYEMTQEREVHRAFRQCTLSEFTAYAY